MIKTGVIIEPFTGVAMVIATGPKDRQRLVARYQIDGEMHSPRGWVQTVRCQKGGAHILVALPERRCASTLHHEALHVVCELLSIHGVVVDYENQELLCYMQEYVVRQIDKAVYKKPRRQKRKVVRQ